MSLGRTSRNEVRASDRAARRCMTLLGWALMGMTAQSALADSDQGVVSAGATLQEVIVTATRREESIDKVPVSMTALSQQTMDDLQIQSLNDLGSIVPGISFTPRGSVNQDYGDIAIRGIYAGNANSPTTQIYIDETPIAIRTLPAALSKSPTPLIFDLDHVEVLRGPQGTLFGASAMGGAIRFLTPQPNMQSASGVAKAELSYSQDGSPNYDVGAAYGAPLIDNALGFRVSAWFRSLGGFIDQENPFTGSIDRSNINRSYDYVIRPAVTWTPTDSLTITPAMFLQRHHDNSPDAYWVNFLPNTQDGLAWGGNVQPATDTLYLPSLAVKYAFAGATLESNTSYLYRNASTIEDQTYWLPAAFGLNPPLYPNPQVFYNDNETSTRAFQQELRLTSQNPAARVTWTVGAFYRRAAQELSQTTPSLEQFAEEVFDTNTQGLLGNGNVTYNGRTVSFFDDFQAIDVSKALFGDIGISLIPRVKADVGVRIEHLSVGNQTQVSGGPFIGATPVRSTLNDENETPITPKLSLTYQITDDDMIYASAAKGFRPGGGNLTSYLTPAYLSASPQCEQSIAALGGAVPAGFKSDSLWSYEVGSKDVLADRRLAIQGSAYYIKWAGIQTGVALPGCFGGFTANEGRATSEGFDLQIAAIVTEHFKLNALVGYNNAYYPDAAYAGVGNTGGLIHPAGEKVTSVVPWDAALNGEYSFDLNFLPSTPRGYLRFDYRWLDVPNAITDPNVQGFDPQIYPFPDQAYGVLNLRLGANRGPWDLSAFVDNATNSQPKLGLQHDQLGDPLLYRSALRPRTFGLTLWYRAL